MVIKQVRDYIWPLRPTGSLCDLWLEYHTEVERMVPVCSELTSANACCKTLNWRGSVKERMLLFCGADLWDNLMSKRGQTMLDIEHFSGKVFISVDPLYGTEKGLKAIPPFTGGKEREKLRLDQSVTRLTQRQVTSLSAGLSIASDHVRRRDHCYVRATLTLEQSP